MRQAEAILSLDIGGTKLAASVLRPDGTPLAGLREPAASEQGPEAMIRRLLAMARRAIASCREVCRTAGISVGGPLDPDAGLVLSPPNLPGWDRVPLRRLVAEGLGLDPARVLMENDANAGALAELRFGAARGRRHAIFLTMSTGLGGGLILDGRLYRGFRRNAGEVGHQIVLADGPPCGCGARGCLEAVASGAGISRRLRAAWQELPEAIRQEAGSVEEVGPEHLFAAARKGDPWAYRFLEETIELLALGIANLVFILNPEVVVLGTLAHHGGDLILPGLDREVRRRCWPILSDGLQIVASPLGPRLEQLSGLSVALEGSPLPPPPGCPPPAGSP